MFDRLLMVMLVTGIWALVLKPTAPVAHSGQECEIEGTGYGEIDGDEVFVYDLNGTAYCY